MAGMRNSQRKRTMVDREVQGAIIKRIFFHWLVFLVITAFAFVFLRAILDDPNLSLATRLENHLGEFLLLGSLIISLLPTFMLDMIRFSSRFAGPIARLTNEMRNLADTGVGREIQFRNNDFWRDISNDYNAVLGLIDGQRQQIADLQRQLASATESKEHQSL
ncbi:MAG TPA: hypothetical protein PKD54_02870 [Pirellulaceae bacterium]|nr:hypothetical protein [Pirellulaceae bacterium]